MQVESEMAVQGVDDVNVELVNTYARDLHRLLRNSELAARKGFVRTLIKRTDVTGDNATIRYKLPLPPDGRISDQT